MSWNTAVLPADPGVSTVSLKRPCIEVSRAVTQNSPSPCTACPSPALNSAPSTFTGKYSVAPGPRRLLSRFPPCAPGRMEESTPREGAGATPICPKNGPVPVALRAISTPRLHGGVAVIRARSRGMMTVSAGTSANSAVLPSAPFPARIVFQPQSVQSSAESTSTFKMSPGRAPATATGPVKMCGPGAPQNAAGGDLSGWEPSREPHCAFQMVWSSSGTSNVSSGTWPGSPLTVHRCTTSPLATSVTGA
mmetsp:Transcript_26599/g.66635  ORF Transcript_26599/g.66635 Transcript_26599/m.66635 type:complete len:249 (-) Transcript_26599:142-888(-)